MLTFSLLNFKYRPVCTEAECGLWLRWESMVEKNWRQLWTQGKQTTCELKLFLATWSDDVIGSLACRWKLAPNLCKKWGKLSRLGVLRRYRWRCINEGAWRERHTQAARTHGAKNNQIIFLLFYRKQNEISTDMTIKGHISSQVPPVGLAAIKFLN